MSKAYILYNPLSGSGEIKNDLDVFEIVIPDEVCYIDLTESESLGRVLQALEEDDYLILCGGDGTLNRFANDTAHRNIENEILYYPCGTGNNFALEFRHHYGDNPFPITQYLKNLPTVTIAGKTYRFLNGVGFGIDGFFCQKSNRQRQCPGKKVNAFYQDLLWKYNPTGATICVDGQTHRYEKIWMAPTMYGKYYSGGMSPAPRQDRESDTLSLLVLHGSNKIRTLMIFPSIFKGTIEKYKKYVSIFPGREITVTFDAPRPLQIDGETVENVISYTARR